MMKETNKKLMEIFEIVDRLEESSEGQLLGGFAVIGGDGASPQGYNGDCDCECTTNVCSNGNCNCKCTDNGCPATTKATSNGGSTIGFTLSF